MQFEEWIKYSFDHPVAQPAWHWASDYDHPDVLAPAVNVEYLQNLFADPGHSLNGLSEAQVNQGLWFIISASSSLCIDGLFSEEVAWDKRKACIASIPVFFREYFAKRCIPELSHNDFTGRVLSASPLNSICYMFWDLIPWAAKRPDPTVYLSYLNALEEILLIDHPACQESALHGLGHAVADYPKRIEETIDLFLSGPKYIRDELRQYAIDARSGNIA